MKFVAKRPTRNDVELLFSHAIGTGSLLDLRTSREIHGDNEHSLSRMREIWRSLDKMFKPRMKM